MSDVSEFAAALRSPTPTSPPGLRAWNDSDVSVRFGVYRNNFLMACIGALEDTFAVTQALVGEDFFRACARQFTQASPPQSSVLAQWGADFADFLADFEPAQALAYLPDMARLEYSRTLAYHAEDALALSVEDLSSRLAGNAWVEQRMGLHASLRVLQSPYAVVTLWQAHQLDAANCEASLKALRLESPEQCMVFRDGVNVVLQPIDSGAFVFVQALLKGSVLSDALLQAQTQEPEFEPTWVLSLLVQSGLILHFSD